MVTEQELSPQILTEVEPGKTAAYLWHFLASKRVEVDPAFFKKNPDIYSKIGHYEKDLEDFVRKPDVIQRGQLMHTLEGEIEQAELKHFQDSDSFTEQFRSLSLEQAKTEGDLEGLKVRINSIGRQRFYQKGNLSLLYGRVQERLWTLQQRDNLSFWGRLATIFIKPQKVHPQIDEQQTRIQQTEDKIASLKEDKKRMDEEYLQQKFALGGKFSRDLQVLFELLDEWSCSDQDRLLVHLIYYRRFETAELFAKKRNLTGQKRRDFLSGLASKGVIPRDYYDFLTRLDPKNKSGGSSQQVKEESNGSEGDKSKLPLKLIIVGSVFDSTEEARLAFFNLNPGLSNTKRKQLWGRLVQFLTYSSLGLSPSGYKVFHKQDRRTAGWDSRLEVKGYRIILNNLRLDGESAIEVLDYVRRDDPKYL